MRDFLPGREREIGRIRQANRAAIVGRLMLGELHTWEEFLQADVVDLEALPRRQLKAGASDVRQRLPREIRRFCSRNFRGLDEGKLSLLYESIKANRGLELPLSDFEKEFALVRPEVLRGNPAHLTLSFSLWGLQFKFPELLLAKDLAMALHLAHEAEDKLAPYQEMTHPRLADARTEVACLVARKDFAARSAILCCYNLMESYLNGLAWAHLQTHDVSRLSNREKKLLEDTTGASIRDKVTKYPQLLTGRPLWQDPDEELDGFIDILKPFRDSLVHPSPFSAPERFGGYDKLRLLYRIDSDTATAATDILVKLVRRIHAHVFGDSQVLPEWVNEIKS